MYCEPTLGNFAEYTSHGLRGDWYSEAFLCWGYKLKFNVETKECHNVPNMPIYFQFQPGNQDNKLKWPVTFAVTIQLVNQLDDCNHYEDSYRFQFNSHATLCEYIF